RTLDRLLSIEESHREIMTRQAEEIQGLKDRLTRLEAHVQAREEIMVAEAKGAASAVASAVASQHIAGLAQTIGRLQGRLDETSARLPPLPGNH
ncbi:MAG TPA: hypothetical protein VGF36_00535, partial [Rhodopila sp.]